MEKPQPQEETIIHITSFSKELKSQLRDWLLVTLSASLIITRVTIIFILALLADDLILIIINLSFGSTITSVPFAKEILLGIQLLSALVGFAIDFVLFAEPYPVLRPAGEAAGNKQLKQDLLSFGRISTNVAQILNHILSIGP